MSTKPGFLDKFIERIGRVGPEDVQSYLTRLAKEKGFLETIFNAIQEGVIVTDPGGRINYVNESACRLFGFAREDCLGKLISDRLRGLKWTEVAGGIERVISREMEVFYPENRILNFYIVPLEGKAGTISGTDISEVIGYAVILRDITETRRSAEQTLESERLSALTLLAAGVAHEIGNPLNSLNIHLQLLERRLRKLPPDLSGPLRESVEVAKEEIARLDSIIHQFLRAIRPTPLDTRPADINQLLQESLDFLQAEITDRDIHIEQELRSDLPPIEVDRNQIKQAFYNIIKNAFQAMKGSGTLRVRTDRDDTHLIVSFTDTGGGVPAEEMSHLFQPYYTTKSSGSGLGLLIVQRIIRAHGGEINLISDEGSGLTFSLRFPFVDSRVRLLGPASAAPGEVE